MPTNIVAVVTDIGRQRILEGLVTAGTALETIDSFKVGEGGWIQTSGGRVPRDPTDPTSALNRGPTLTDLDVISNSGSYPADSQATFSKALANPDFAVSGNTTLKVTCFLDFGEFNNDGFGNDPEIYEIGIFNTSGEMVAYGTCPLVTKNVAVSRTFVVRIKAER